eukprot:677804-Amphidinium_carterae.1
MKPLLSFKFQIVKSNTSVLTQTEGLVHAGLVWLVVEHALANARGPHMITNMPQKWYGHNAHLKYVLE